MKSKATRANRFTGSVVEGQIWVAREFCWRPPTGDGDLSSGGIMSGGARQRGGKIFFFVVGCGVGERRSVAANSDITILWILAAMQNRFFVMSILHGQWYHVISTLAARSPNIEKIQIMQNRYYMIDPMQFRYYMNNFDSTYIISILHDRDIM